MILRDLHDQLDRLHLRDEGQVGRFLLFRDRQMVQFPPLLRRQHLQNVARGHSPQRVEPLFGQMQLVPSQDDLPCAPVKGHGVGQRAVAIEDEALRGHVAFRY